MARFYVGQRVRIVRSERGHLGKEATVLGPLMEAFDRNHYVGYPISIDGIGASFFDGCQIVAPSDWIAPLTNPGREVVSWDACAWKPEHLRDKVS